MGVHQYGRMTYMDSKTWNILNLTWATKGESMKYHFDSITCVGLISKECTLDSNSAWETRLSHKLQTMQSSKAP